MFTITRFFVAIFLNGLYVATFTYSMELLNSKFRTFTGVNIQAQFAVGYVILGFLRAVDQIEHHKSNFCASHNHLFKRNKLKSELCLNLNYVFNILNMDIKLSILLVYIVIYTIHCIVSICVGNMPYNHSYMKLLHKRYHQS